MKSKNNYLFFVLLVIPAILIFRAFFLPGPLSWGDAPYYSQGALEELFNEPFAWVNGGIFGQINNLYWIYPVSFLFGLLNKIFGFSSEALIRLFFYFPALISSLVTPILFARYLRLSRIAHFFSSIIYTFNTYLILLIDGGQVGVALAYGIFPLFLLLLLRLRNKISLVNFYQALGGFVLISIADTRIAIVGLLTIVVWSVVEVIAKTYTPSKEHFKILFLFGISALGLSAYWLYPSTKLLASDIRISNEPLQLLSLLNPLFLFQPHWPANEFGKIFPVPFYFVGIPLLTFGSLLIKRKESYILALCVLIFAYLTKGTTPPLGGIYEILISKAPLGEAFRDSSKFFAPTILFSAILIGATSEKMFNLLTKKSELLGKAGLCVVVVYLLSLILPAIKGDLNGVLAGRKINEEIESVNNAIRADEKIFRTVWFPEKHPWGFNTFKKSAVDAKNLVDSRPFTTLNTGTFDRFNFLHNSLSTDFLKLFGVKHLIFTGDTRKTLNEEGISDWDRLLALVDSREDFKKLPEQKVPVYEISNIKPRIFLQDNAIFVLGGDNIYQKILESDKSFSLQNQGFIFLEDGKSNSEKLLEIASESAILAFNEKDQTDLKLSFLQNYFEKPLEKSQWAFRSGSEYLKWKYELLVQNVKTSEFDYGRGIAFSTKQGENLSFNLEVPSDDKYILAVRSMFTEGNTAAASFDDNDFNLSSDALRFTWTIKENIQLKKGVHKLEIKSGKGTNVVNTAAIIPSIDWNQAEEKAKEVVDKFVTIDVENPENLKNISSNSRDITFEQISPVRYLINEELSKGKWIVFSDSFNPHWNLKNNRTSLESYPFYSGMNGFYIQHKWPKAEIYFEGQKEVEKGMFLSGISLVLLGAFYIGKITYDQLH